MKLRFSMFAFFALMLIGMVALVHVVETPVHATVGTGYATVPYDPANFSTNTYPAMTFTVGTVNTYRYKISDNNELHLMLDLKDASITGNTASGFLAVKLPEGRTAGRTVRAVGSMSTDNGNSGIEETCYVLISQNAGWIYIRRSSGANWPTITNTLRVNADLVLEVNEAP